MPGRPREAAAATDEMRKMGFAPGQAAVVYDESDTRVLGGGWIADSA